MVRNVRRECQLCQEAWGGEGRLGTLRKHIILVHTPIGLTRGDDRAPRSGRTHRIVRCNSIARIARLCVHEGWSLLSATMPQLMVHRHNDDYQGFGSLGALYNMCWASLFIDRCSLGAFRLQFGVAGGV